MLLKYIAALWLLPVCFQTLAAQTTGQASGEIESKSLRRFSFGGRVSIVTGDMMSSETIERSTSDPAVTTTISATSKAKRVGGGVTVQFALLDRLAISADVLYRRAGYERSLTRVEGTTTTTTTAETESTRADYWDVPVMARFFSRGRGQTGPRPFLAAGLALRHVNGIRTLREVTRADGLSDTYETPAEPVNRNLPGLVVGGGIQLRDDVGFKIAPEVRFTRWFGRSYDDYPVRSMKNQLEVVLGLTF